MLERLLRACGSPSSAAAAREIALGALAAPRGHEPDAWMRLIAERPSRELAQELEALRLELAASRCDGLGVAPAPRSRLEALRGELARRNLTGFVVPRTDEHHNEYVARCAERLEWLTGFSGSAGTGVVLDSMAALFVDGRYTLQAKEQVDAAAFSRESVEKLSAAGWIKANAKPGARIGYDPWLHSEREVEALRAACLAARAELVATEGNPIDAVWRDRPAAPIAPVVPQPLEHAGKSSADKRAEIAALVRAKGADALVLSQPDSIAWLLNVRGGDLPCTPFVLAFAVLRADAKLELFVDSRKLTAAARQALGPDVSVRPASELSACLAALGAANASVLLDPKSAPSALGELLRREGAQLVLDANPCALPKAIKNEAELNGARAAHLRDGVAVTRFLAWLSRRAPRGGLTELDVVAKLGKLRRTAQEARGDSFDAISGAGPNGAIVHYRATEKTNRRLEPGSVFLLDSGGQYVDGTTDITRTVALGEVPAEAKDRFTRVLRGHLALAMARFPKGTVGMQLDTLARHALWEAGLDYDHGTGHGVGSFLSVHEGPAGISKTAQVPLEAGMILSNEPGYYKAGEYGIRIENLVAVREVAVPGGERAMLELETLTLVPIDRNMIDVAQLSSRERAWIDAYHARVCTALAPLLDARDRAWLEAATAPLDPASS